MSDITVKPSLDEIVSLLGRFFGTTSKSAFLSQLAKSRQSSGLETTIETSPTILGDVILDMQQGGKFTYDIIRQVAEKIDKKGDGTATTAEATNFNQLEKTFRVTYEPTAETEKCSISHGHTAGAKTNDQGTPQDAIYSIRKVLGIGGENIINKSPEAPDKLTSPCLSVIQMFPSTLTPANRDTGAISLLLNAIPTLEISRAVPFIDIVAISRTPMLSMDGNETNSGRIMQLSLGQFLLGNEKVSGHGVTIAGAIDAAVAKDPPPPLDNDVKKADRVIVQMPFGTAGMELFTSPQTLVNADELHHEFDSIQSQKFNTLTGESAGSTLHPGGKRAAPVIDRFRPLMSLVDFKVNVSPTKGTMSYKSAEMNLVLHDRSRLAEVAAFVKPDNFNRNHFLIEYGWAHPENKVHEFRPLGNGTNISALDTAEYSNLIGQFIAQMKAKEKYHVVNSSFSFDDAGQVQINVKLAMLGGDDGYRVKIGQGGAVEEQVEAIRKITEAIAIVRKKISDASRAGDGSEDIMGDGNVLNVASTTESAVNLKKEDIEKISKFIKKNSSKSAVQEIEILKDAFAQLLGPKGNGKGGKLADLQQSIADEINRKMKIIKNGYDPWLRPISLHDTDINEKNIKSYVSLGKIFTVFLGMPLADTRKFDDIQIYFYAFNDKASFAKNLNIAQFPIPKNDLDTMLKEELKLEANLPIMKFINFINKAFINDQGSPAYGMSSIYKDRSKDNKFKREIAKKFEEDGTAMFGEKQVILKKAYGEDAELLFKMPTLRIKLEAVPAANKTVSSDGVNEPGAEKTILRMHIFDAQTSSFTCLSSLLSAAKRNQIGVITKSAGNVINRRAGDTSHDEQFNSQLAKAVEEGLLEPIPLDATARKESDGRRFYRLAGGFPSLKNFIMRSMPSVRYGSQNSGILKANVQSMQNALLSTVNMQRQGLRPGDEPQNKRDAGVPMTVQPVECSLETIGCPLWEFGQQIFIDFGTGTSVDNVYQVTGLDHTIKSGEFKTNVKMTSLLSWGVYESMIDRVMEADAVLSDYESKK